MRSYPIGTRINHLANEDAGDAQIEPLASGGSLLPSNRVQEKARRNESSDRSHASEYVLNPPIKLALVVELPLRSILTMRLLDGFTDFIGAALKVGKAVIPIATDLHQRGLLQRLQARGVDVAALVEQKRFIPLDVADSLPTFMVDDSPDPVRLSESCS